MWLQSFTSPAFMAGGICRVASGRAPLFPPSTEEARYQGSGFVKNRAARIGGGVREAVFAVQRSEAIELGFSAGIVHRMDPKALSQLTRPTKGSGCTKQWKRAWRWR